MTGIDGHITPLNSEIRVITDEAELNSPITRALYSWWSGQGQIPSRNSFDISDHLSIASHIFLVKVRDRDCFEIRLNGEVVVEALGHSERGTVIRTDNTVISSPDQHHQNQARHYQTIVDDALPRLFRGDFTNLDRRHVQFESVDLPLIDEAGQVTHIIGALDPVHIQE